MEAKLYVSNYKKKKKFNYVKLAVARNKDLALGEMLREMIGSYQWVPHTPPTYYRAVTPKKKYTFSFGAYFKGHS